MTSDQFVRWLEGKLVEHGAQKVVPAADTLVAAYTRAKRTAAHNREMARLQETLTHEAIQVPDDLAERVQALLKKSPELSWDAVIWQIVQLEGDVPP